MSIAIKNLLNLLLLNFVHCGLESNLPRWLIHLSQYIQRESSTHQVMFMTENDASLSRDIDIITQTIAKNTPTLHMSIQQANKEKIENPKLFHRVEDPRATTLFIVITFLRNTSDTSKLTGPINFITTASLSKTHPRCLFILFSKENDSSFETLLRNMWSKKLLDVTILEIVESQKEKANVFITKEKNLAIVHQFNPFINYTKKNHSQTIQWFPNKLKNLHGHNMKAGIFDHPPTVYTSHNSTGHVIKFSGYDVSIADTLSQVMNFSITNVPSPQLSFGKYSCSNKNLTGGLNYKLLHEEIQFIIISGFIAPKCIQGYAVFDIIGIYSVVPIIKIEDFTLDWKSVAYNALPMLILALSSVWILVRVLRFETRYWRLMYILQIILQSCAPVEPRKFKERVIFVFILMVCIAFASDIHAAFTSLELSIEREKEFNNLYDVVESGLQPISLDNVKGLAKQVEGELVLKLVENYIQYADIFAACSEHIVNYKNVTCLLQRDRAELLHAMTRDEDGGPRVKIVEEALWQYGIGLALEPNSPYSEEFEILFTRMRQAGLVAKWKKDSLYQAPSGGKKSYFEEIEESGQMKIRILLQAVLILGYSCSLLAFVFEILIPRAVRVWRGRM